MLTIRVCVCDGLQHGLTRPYPFLWHRTNYVLKMVTDLDWIVESDLMPLIQYATLRNPLLLPRDTETGRAQRKRTRAARAQCVPFVFVATHSIIVRWVFIVALGDVKELEMQRIRSAERAILDEADIQRRREFEYVHPPPPVPRKTKW